MAPNLTALPSPSQETRFKASGSGRGASRLLAPAGRVDLEVLVTASALVWLSLPAVVSLPDQRLTIALQGLPFLAVIMGRVLAGPASESRERDAVGRGWHPVLLVFLAVSAISIVRDSVSASRAGDLMLLIALVAFAFVVFRPDQPAGRRRELLLALAAAPSVFVGANILLWLFSVESMFTTTIAVGDPATMLASFGVSASRVAFPLQPGVNTFGVIAALAFSVSALMAVVYRRRARLVWVGATLMCLGTLLLTDSRASLVWSLVSISLVLLLRHRPAVLRWSAAIVVVSPILALTLIGLTISGDQASGRNLTSGSARLAIWNPAVAAVSKVDSESLFGWGRRGQVPAGVASAQQYLYGYGGGSSAAAFAQHNFALQTVLDMGYAGLLAAGAVFFLVISRLAEDVRRSEPTAVAFLAAMLALVLIGITEAAPTWASPAALAWFLLVAIAMGAARVNRARA